ncbi:polysaccharide deacetylase family protein [Noviherbaspirillum massiliense]|uniref:polysaccharide deacetylase family protein n=1 Tax=Noviherbaspirillum massiliense TaxID=1465823 RepID=UPI00036CDCC3|nr:polysaccharide deacetylase family protein [Noviherbaspirillum massiliense]
MNRKLKLLVFLLARMFGVFALFRILTRSRIRILCYHGGCIGDEHGYNPLLFCPADVFESRVRWLLDKGFNIIPLDKAVSMLAASASRPRLPTVITFDDGWFSTGHTLLPVLRKWDLPSTLYVCTEHFLQGWAVPAVTIRYIVWKSARTKLTLSGLHQDLDGSYDLGNPSSRQMLSERAVAWVSKTFHTREEVHAGLHRFADCLGVPEAALALESRRFEYLSRDELLRAQAGGCSIELHGHVHRYPAGDPAALERDLQICRQTILAMGLPQPGHYCYPSGNFDACAATALQRMGVASATTCLPGLVATGGKDDRYYLPRFLDGGNVSALEFEAEMSGFTDFIRRCTGRLKASLACVSRRFSTHTACFLLAQEMPRVILPEETGLWLTFLL